MFWGCFTSGPAAVALSAIRQMEDMYLRRIRLGVFLGQCREHSWDGSAYQVTIVIGCATENLIFLAMLSRRTRFATTAIAT